ncbi:hypothetical protein Liucustia_08 [Acinetobacter phage Liucustia]|nr:hypothetical protein Liucustia_08 [Acinetobacter phage Liucustia]
MSEDTHDYKFNNVYKYKAWFRVTLKEDVVFHKCLVTLVEQITKHTGFTPTNGVSMSGNPLQTTWFEMDKTDTVLETDHVKLVEGIWSAMANVYGAELLECSGLTCVPEFSIEKIYED